MHISHSVLSCRFWEVGCDALTAAALPESSYALSVLSEDETVGKIGKICIFGDLPTCR